MLAVCHDVPFDKISSNFLYIGQNGFFETREMSELKTSNIFTCVFVILVYHVFTHPGLC